MNAQADCIARPICPVCAAHGTLKYACAGSLGSQGMWSIRRCNDRVCGSWWLDPLPSPRSLAESYADYFTHEAGAVVVGGFKQSVVRAILEGSLGYPAGASAPSRFAGRILGVVPGIRDEAARRVMWLPRTRGGTLLDVGCGNGAFLARMRDFGWRVVGVEPDPRAAATARRERSLDVFGGTLEAYAAADGAFDAITLNHVIEHAPDPVALVRECQRVLAPGGALVVVTPNVAGLGARLFGNRWRGLEVPRHLCLFSPTSLVRVFGATSLTIRTLRTPSRSARWMWAESRNRRTSLSERALGWSFQFIEQLATTVARVGEEILLVATKD